MALSAGFAESYPVTLVRKSRRLPLPGEVLVSPGDRVGPDDVVAKISLRPGIPWVIPVARMLGIEAAELPRCMQRRVGERIKLKEVVARAEQGLYGRKEYESPTDGVIEEVSPLSGRVVIREEFGRAEPPLSLDVAVELGVKPQDLNKFMLRKVGEEVKRGQIIAKKGEQAAFFTKSAITPISGIVSEVNTKTGYVTISRPFKEVVVRAYVRGKVSEVLPNRGVVVETPAVRITGIFGVGRETHGEVALIADSPEATVLPEMIGPQCKDKILVGGGFVTDEALRRALEVGAKGLITGTAGYINIVRSLGVKLGVGITGQEDVPLTLILMEGFGHLSMRQHAFEALSRLTGREASINGATQIRAGAIRPEIIVPFPEQEGVSLPPGLADEELSLGQPVRIINDPYFGKAGVVTALPREAERIETEAMVPVVRVKLQSGEEVTVPRANVEIF
jgi:hypothetical protein